MTELIHSTLHEMPRYRDCVTLSSLNHVEVDGSPQNLARTGRLGASAKCQIICSRLAGVTGIVTMKS